MILELLLASLLLALVGIFLDLLLGPRSCSNRLRLAGEASRLVGWYVGWLVEWLVGWMDEWMVGWLVGSLNGCFVGRLV